MDAGDLVPDQVTNAMVRDRLAESDTASGFLLDGFPRNVAQAYELDGMLADLGSSLDVVLELIIDDDEVVRRLSGRRTCRNCRHVWHVEFDPTTVEGVLRPVRRRALPARRRQAGDRPAPLEVYAEQTAPLVEFYARRGQLVGIDAMGAVEDVTDRAIGVLSPYAAAS
jgi:adenylate kinase